MEIKQSVLEQLPDRVLTRPKYTGFRLAQSNFRDGAENIVEMEEYTEPQFGLTLTVSTDVLANTASRFYIEILWPFAYAREKLVGSDCQILEPAGWTAKLHLSENLTLQFKAEPSDAAEMLGPFIKLRLFFDGHSANVQWDKNKLFVRLSRSEFAAPWSYRQPGVIIDDVVQVAENAGLRKGMVHKI